MNRKFVVTVAVVVGFAMVAVVVAGIIAGVRANSGPDPYDPYGMAVAAVETCDVADVVTPAKGTDPDVAIAASVSGDGRNADLDLDQLGCLVDELGAPRSYIDKIRDGVAFADEMRTDLDGDWFAVYEGQGGDRGLLRAFVY